MIPTATAVLAQQIYP